MRIIAVSVLLFSSLLFSTRKIPTTSKWRENAQPQPGNGLTLLAGLYLIDNSVETTSSTQYSQTSINKTSLNRCSIMQVSNSAQHHHHHQRRLHSTSSSSLMILFLSMRRRSRNFINKTTQTHSHERMHIFAATAPRRRVVQRKHDAYDIQENKVSEPRRRATPYSHIRIPEEMHFVLVFYRILTPTGSHLYIR